MFCALTGKLHCLIVAAVCPDLADNGKDQISCVNALRKLPCQVKFTVSGTMTQEVPVTIP